MREAHRVMVLIRPILKGVCLDAGAGDSRNLCLLPQGSVGLDLKIPNRLKQYSYVQGDLNSKLPFRNGSFDSILCAHVLEHLSNPPATLKEFHRVLKENGTLIIAIPNPNCIYYNFYDSSLHPDHIKSWSKKDMKLLLTDSNFEVSKTYINLPFIANKWFGLIWNNIPLLDRIWCDWWFISKRL